VCPECAEIAEQQTAPVCSTCGKVDNSICSSAFHLKLTVGQKLDALVALKGRLDDLDNQIGDAIKILEGALGSIGLRVPIALDLTREQGEDVSQLAWDKCGGGWRLVAVTEKQGVQPLSDTARDVRARILRVAWPLFLDRAVAEMDDMIHERTEALARAKEFLGSVAPAPSEPAEEETPSRGVQLIRETRAARGKGGK
jgi:hypothetical protein